MDDDDDDGNLIVPVRHSRYLLVVLLASLVPRCRRVAFCFECWPSVVTSKRLVSFGQLTTYLQAPVLLCDILCYTCPKTCHKTYLFKVGLHRGIRHIVFSSPEPHP